MTDKPEQNQESGRTDRKGRTADGRFASGNRASLTSGVKAILTTGRLAKPYTHVANLVKVFERQLRGIVSGRCKGSPIPLADECRINSAVRHEMRALICRKMLADKGKALTIEQTQALLADITAASQARDKEVKNLRLDERTAGGQGGHGNAFSGFANVASQAQGTGSGT